MIQIRNILAFKPGAETVKFDFSPWAEDNGSVSAVTWTVKSGQAAIANKTLASNVAQAVITTSESGGSLIQIKATAGNNVYITHLDILAKDPYRITDDYGLRHG